MTPTEPNCGGSGYEWDDDSALRFPAAAKRCLGCDHPNCPNAHAMMRQQRDEYAATHGPPTESAPAVPEGGLEAALDRTMRALDEAEARAKQAEERAERAENERCPDCQSDDPNFTLIPVHQGSGSKYECANPFHALAARLSDTEGGTDG